MLRDQVRNLGEHMHAIIVAAEEIVAVLPTIEERVARALARQEEASVLERKIEERSAALSKLNAEYESLKVRYEEFKSKVLAA